MSPVITSRALAAYRQAESTRPVVRAELTKEAGEALSAIAPISRAVVPHELAKIHARREVIAFRLTAVRASQARQVERAAAWSRWQWIRWGAPWLALGLALGAIIVAVVNHYV